mgnify:CR=1 FL=1
MLFERVIDLLEDVLGGKKGARQILAHAHGLGPLAGKYKRAHHGGHPFCR